MIADAVVTEQQLFSAYRMNELGGVTIELFDSVAGEWYTISVRRGRKS